MKIKFLDGTEEELTSLQGASLQGADLRCASLQSASLRCASLQSASLQSADLQGADLRCARLWGANLQGADLWGANLQGADLWGANLQGARLRSANLQGARLPHFQIVPSEGAFTAWKKCTEGVIKIEIPAEARRTSALVGRKCRAEFVRTLEVPDGVDEATSKADCDVTYVVGEITRADSYDDDIRVECSHGIHFFMTRREAEEY
jgi:hypothetical protein